MRAWFLCSVVFAVFVIGVNLMNGSTQWTLVLGVSAFPLVAGVCLKFAARYVRYGGVRYR